MYILSIEPLELVEELAIRYMEAHFGPHDLEAAAQAKNLCIGSWLADVSSFRGLRCRRADLGTTVVRRRRVNSSWQWASK